MIKKLDFAIIVFVILLSCSIFANFGYSPNIVGYGLIDITGMTWWNPFSWDEEENTETTTINPLQGGFDIIQNGGSINDLESWAYREKISEEDLIKLKNEWATSEVIKLGGMTDFSSLEYTQDEIVYLNKDKTILDQFLSPEEQQNLNQKVNIIEERLVLEELSLQERINIIKLIEEKTPYTELETRIRNMGGSSKEIEYYQEQWIQEFPDENILQDGLNRDEINEIIKKMEAGESISQIIDFAEVNGAFNEDIEKYKNEWVTYHSEDWANTELSLINEDDSIQELANKYSKLEIDALLSIRDINKVGPSLREKLERARDISVVSEEQLVIEEEDSQEIVEVKVSTLEDSSYFDQIKNSVEQKKRYIEILEMEDIEKLDIALSSFIKTYEEFLTDSERKVIAAKVSDVLKSYEYDQSKSLLQLTSIEQNYKTFFEIGNLETRYNQMLENRVDNLYDYIENPSKLTNEDRIIQDRIIQDLEYLNQVAKLDDTEKKQLQKLKQQRWQSLTIYEKMDILYQGAIAGRYLADKFGIAPFEFTEQLFQSTFGKLITGEPPAGVCDKAIRKTGNSQGIIVDDSLMANLVAHIEGEKTAITNVDGTTEYFYKITLQIKSKKDDENINYNIDLYKNNILQTAVFAQEQSKKGTVNHIGESALLKYSIKDYDKVCLRSSAGNTCNRFADVTEFANVEVSKALPSAGTATGTGTTVSAGSSTPNVNDW